MINADIPISLYVLQNSLNIDKKKTEITSVLKRRNLTTTSNEYLNKDYSIPLAYHSIFNKLINFIETNNLKLEYSTKTVKSIGVKTKIPSNYKLEDMLAIDTYTIKDGLMVKKMTEEHPDMKIKKLIISNKSSFTGAFIDDGKLGLTGSDKTYIVGDNLEIILKMLKFKISDIIGHFTKYRQDFLEKEVYTYLPDIRKLGLEDINEKEFYQLIGLTQDEIKLFDKSNIIIDDINSQTNNTSDENIIIPKVSKKKTTKKITIDKVKKEEIKIEDIGTDKYKEIKKEDNNIIIEEDKPKEVKAVKKIKVKKENNIIIEEDKPKEDKEVKKIKVKKEDNILIEEDKPKVKTIKKVKSKKETNEI